MLCSGSSGDMVRLYQTIRKDGKLFVRGFIKCRNNRRDFQMEETTVERAFERLRILRDLIDANHPRQSESRES